MVSISGVWFQLVEYRFQLVKWIQLECGQWLVPVVTKKTLKPTAKWQPLLLFTEPINLAIPTQREVSEHTVLCMLIHERLRTGKATHRNPNSLHRTLAHAESTTQLTRLSALEAATHT